LTRGLDLSKMLGEEIIDINARVLRNVEVPEHVIQVLEREALGHLDQLRSLYPGKHL